MSATKIVAH